MQGELYSVPFYSASCIITFRLSSPVKAKPIKSNCFEEIHESRKPTENSVLYRRPLTDF